MMKGIKSIVQKRCKFLQTITYKYSSVCTVLLSMQEKATVIKESVSPCECWKICETHYTVGSNEGKSEEH